jgi:hypothetical protein
MNKTLAKIIRRAAKLHEESWNDQHARYCVGLLTACQTASRAEGQDEKLGELVYYLLYGTWNDSLQWAAETI